MKNVREEDLIAYHLGELSLIERLQMKRRLKKDAELAAQSVASQSAGAVILLVAGLAAMEAVRRADRTWAVAALQKVMPLPA